LSGMLTYSTSGLPLVGLCNSIIRIVFLTSIFKTALVIHCQRLWVVIGSCYIFQVDIWITEFLLFFFEKKTFCFLQNRFDVISLGAMFYLLKKECKIRLICMDGRWSEGTARKRTPL
jgi:hypothetical protein